MAESDWTLEAIGGALSIHIHETPGAPGSRTIALHHPSRPYVRNLPRPAARLHALHPAVLDYLGRVWPALRMETDKWLQDLRIPPGPEVDTDEIACAWLPERDPRGARWIERHAHGEAPERSAIVMAGLALRSAGARLWPLYGGQGLAVPVAVDETRRRVAITGLTCTLPPFDKVEGRSRLEGIVERLKADLFAAFALDGRAELQDYGLHLVDRENVDVTALVANVDPHVERGAPGWFRGSELLIARWDATSRRVIPISRSRRAASATRVLERDPVSATGPEGFRALRPYRTEIDAKGIDDAITGRNGGLANQWLRVVDSPWTVRGRAPSAAPVYPRDSTSVRGNAAAAVHAFRNVNALFDRMAAWGFDPRPHLPFVRLPLQVEYRSGITPGPGKDGRTVNAQVLWGEPGSVTTFGRILGDGEDTLAPTPLVMRFALAHLRASTERAPLGIAADPRWCWHELAHVLLAGATGELEFRFAHSAGDALGAILADPDSMLTREPGWRGLSFPWVHLPRRHDRKVEEGWGWSGSRYMRERFFPTPHLCDRRAYWTEQIMSSTLFHLYRLLGGDAGAPAAPDLAARRAAADYTACLIVSAILRLPPAVAVASVTPQVFVNALIDADRAIASFGAGALRRRGGAAAKLIAHAFRQQGLREGPMPAPVNQAARPPVDVFADDGGGGEYVPQRFVDDAWMRAAAVTLRPSAGPGAGQAPRSGRPAHVRVRFGNRGESPAGAGARIHVHVARWTGASPPPWNPVRWTSLGSAPLGSSGGESAAVRWDVPAGSGSYAVLAALEDPADPSLLDPASAAPCAAGPTPLRLLLAGDNNLALRRVEVA